MSHAFVETERLTTRPFVPGDYGLFYSLRNDEEVSRYLGGTDNLHEKVSSRLTYYLSHQARYGYAMSVISLKATGEVVGWGGLQHLDDGEEHEVGYGFVRAHWGRGYATEFAGGCLDFGFVRRGFDRIVAVADPDNLASRHVMEKLGMTYEKNIIHYGVDAVYYAISRETWLQRRAK